MKTILILILAISCFTAKAGLITYSSSNTGEVTQNDTVSVDVLINNINPEIAELEFEVLFDDSLFTFEGFSFSTGVQSSAFITDSYETLFSSVNLYALWFDSLDVPGTSFNLGTLSFKAITNANLQLTEQLVFIGDNFGGSVSNPQQVPEPSTIFMILLAVLMMFGFNNRRYQ